jgi:hypothetical protein
MILSTMHRWMIPSLKGKAVLSSGELANRRTKSFHSGASVPKLRRRHSLRGHSSRMFYRFRHIPAARRTMMEKTGRHGMNAGQGTGCVKYMSCTKLNPSYNFLLFPLLWPPLLFSCKNLIRFKLNHNGGGIMIYHVIDTTSRQGTHRQVPVPEPTLTCIRQDRDQLLIVPSHVFTQKRYMNATSINRRYVPVPPRSVFWMSGSPRRRRGVFRP